jgi:hypothetical protein
MTRTERAELILCYVAQAFRRNPDDGQLITTPRRVENAMIDLLADFEERMQDRGPTLRPAYPHTLRTGT